MVSPERGVQVGDPGATLAFLKGILVLQVLQIIIPGEGIRYDHLTLI